MRGGSVIIWGGFSIQLNFIASQRVLEDTLLSFLHGRMGGYGIFMQNNEIDMFQNPQENGFKITESKNVL